MRTDSHRFVATLIAAGFVAGWLSGSWVNPPTAATQERPARAATSPVDVPMPHIALDAVAAPSTTPVAIRNPFVFADRPAPVPARGLHARLDDVPSPGTTPGDAAGAVLAPEPPPWRVVGFATDAEGRVTAIVSGRGDVLLLALGDRLPDGAIVVELDETRVVVEQASGTRLTLRLP